MVDAELGMRVFISWSGERSRLLANLLRDWLPEVIQTIEPWLSSEDVSKGTNWSLVLEEELRHLDAAILCVTNANASSPWLHYEFGVLVDRQVPIYPVLLDITPAEVTGPLARAYLNPTTQSGMFRLVQAFNSHAANPAPNETLERNFTRNWPDLSQRLEQLLKSDPFAQRTPQRSADEKLDEVLDTVQTLAKSLRTVSDRILTTAVTPPPIANDSFENQRTKPRLFIGSSVEGKSVAQAIQATLEHEVEAVIWDQEVFPPSLGTMESLVGATKDFDFAAIVMTADDIMIKRGIEHKAPRDNLLFEVGLFTGALGRARTFVVHPRDKDLEFPSDFQGVTKLSYDGNRSDKNVFAAVGPPCTRMKGAMGLL